ncbi:MAG: hypothetical protein KAV87_59570, partial [Desulfobacteraceae bacterium]|nr:hypothetical protein [Desulfobacteraceae bacterium]
MYFLKISKSSESDQKVNPPFGRELTTQRFAGPGVVVSVGTDETNSAVAKEGDRLVIIDALNPDLVNQIDLSSLGITAQNYPNLLGDHLFSLVFVDLSRRTISLIRSICAARFLYFGMTDSDFYCASSIGLLKHLGCRFEPNEKILPELWVYRFTLSPQCLVKGVHKLAAGELVELQYFDRSSIKSHHFDFNCALPAAPVGLDEASRGVN